MYEELFGKPIEQVVVLIAGEDGSMTAFIKEKKDYEEKDLRFILDISEEIYKIKIFSRFLISFSFCVII